MRHSTLVSLAAALLLAAGGAAQAQFPERAMRIVVPFEPGGATTRLESEMFQLQNGVKVEIIPYSGTGRASAAVLAGEADFVIMDTSPVISLIKAGKLKPVTMNLDEARAWYLKEITAWKDVVTKAGIKPAE